MKLSVVILNYNVRYFLELCIKSVQAAIVELNAEIIVVDNQSSDDSCEMVKALFPNVVLIENTENYGFSKGNNIGVAKAQGDYVCILNPDTVVAEDCFTKLLNFADQKTDLGILGCKLIDGRGQFLPESKRNVPTPNVSIKKIFGNSEPYYANHVHENEIGKVSILVGAFMLVKRSVYNKVNGFDEDFFMYGEDMDLSYRIKKAGYQNYYNPITTVIHFKGESTLKDKNYAKRFNGAMQIFFKKHFKSNVITAAIISIGVKAIVLFNPKPKIENNRVDSFVLVSERDNQQLSYILNKPIQLYSTKLVLKDGQQIILDNNTLSFKTIVDSISNWSKNAELTFKILPKNSCFLIGSNSSKGKGEIIKF